MECSLTDNIVRKQKQKKNTKTDLQSSQEPLSIQRTVHNGRGVFENTWNTVQCG